MRCSTSLQGCSQSSVTCLGEPTYGSIRMSFALAQSLVVMPSPLIVSAEPECHLYFARRVTFLSCADISPGPVHDSSTENRPLATPAQHFDDDLLVVDDDLLDEVADDLGALVRRAAEGGGNTSGTAE